MKTRAIILATAAAIGLVACDEKKPVEKVPPAKIISAVDLKPPANVPPPVETQPYEDGFAAGTNAGEIAGKIKPARGPAKLPTPEEIEVIALETAGANPDRGPKWQRGFVSGYRDGFSRTAKGIR